MRLPWPFGRSTDQPATSADAPALPAAPAPTGPAAPGAWASLPPIQRSIGAAPLVAPSDAFLAGVPGARPLPPIVEPLGHDVSPVASGGLVGATVRTTPSLTSHAPLVPAPVQRRADPSANAWTGALDEPHVEVVASEPASVPERTLSVVTPEATVRPSARPLTRADAIVASGPAVAASSSVSAPGDRPLVSRRTQVSTSTIPSVVSPAAPSSMPTVSRWAASADVPHAPGLGRRTGLGAPLPSTPSSAVGAGIASAFPAPVLAQLAASRAAGPSADAPASPLDLASVQRTTRPTAGGAPLRTTIQRRTASTTPTDAGADADEPLGSSADLPLVAAVEGGRLPVLSVVGAPATSASAAPTAGAALQRATSSVSIASATETTPPTTTVASSGSSTPPLRRPLLGSRPIQTSIQTTRSDDSSGDGGDGAGTPLRLVPAGSESEPASASGSLPTFGAGSSPSWGGPAAPTAQRQAAEPLLARRPAVAVDPFGSATPATASGSTRTVAAAPSMALARPAAPTVIAAPVAAPSPPTVSRSIVAAPEPAPVVQASRDGATSTASTPAGFGPTATPIVQRLDGAAPIATPTDSGHSDHELDELAKAIFGRLRNRLRSEYIHEREAKGLTFDNS